MDKAPRDEIADLLSTFEPAHRDSASLRLPARMLDIRVEGMGDLSFPLDEDQAERLITVADPAHFGRGEDTVHDTSVRDTWQLGPESVTIGSESWDPHLGEALERLAAKLGIADLPLQLELHSLLVYREGQFFAPHQDSEKNDGMIATLVVALPSPHSGGELVVDDGGERRVYSGSATDAELVCFYADRRHEVLPVTAGFRVTLTFNVIVNASRRDEWATGDPGLVHGADSKPAEVAELAGLLQQHFSTPVKPRYSQEPASEPIRLAFLLDHEYSEHGIDPIRLKGADRVRHSLLTAAAAAADCDIALGLSEIHETWNADPSGGLLHDEGYGSGGKYRCGFDDRFGYDHEDDSDEEDWGEDDWGQDHWGEDTSGSSAGETAEDLGELIDDTIVLTWWNDREQPGRIRLALGEEEVCSVIRTIDLEPYASEFEGYMGNYGNTIDRWYRRAVLLVWPRSAAFANRAEASTPWALVHIAETLADGHVDRARQEVEALSTLWSPHSVGENEFGPALRIAGEIGDAGLAADLLKPFAVELATESSATALARLGLVYGSRFVEDLLAEWARTGIPYRRARDEWLVGELPALAVALGEHDAADLRDAVVNWVWGDLETAIGTTVRARNAAKREVTLDTVGPQVAALLDSSGPRLAESIAASLCALDGPATPLLVSVLKAASGRYTGSAPPAASGEAARSSDGPYRSIAERARDQLTARLQEPVRATEDWSIAWDSEPPQTSSYARLATKQEDVEDLAHFLRSAERRIFEWPLAKPRRQTIHHILDRDGLPVTHVTVRSGRPYTLVLTKTAELFTREEESRARAAADLAWLDEAFDGDATR